MMKVLLVDDYGLDHVDVLNGLFNSCCFMGLRALKLILDLRVRYYCNCFGPAHPLLFRPACH